MAQAVAILVVVMSTILIADHVIVHCPIMQVQAACNDNSSGSVEELAESMRCANLENISIPSPFVITEEHKDCVNPGDSADFVLANCSPITGPRAFWKTFTNALPRQEIGPPAIVGLIASAPHGDRFHVNLTWDSSSMHRPQPFSSVNTSKAPALAPPSACRHPRSSTNLSHYFPTYMSLSKLHANNTKVKLSSNTVFLLFNCSSLDRLGRLPGGPGQLVAHGGSPLCEMYKGTCSPNLKAMFGAAPSCHQLDWDDDELSTNSNSRYMDLYGGLTELSLQSILDDMSCTHFEVFVFSSSGTGLEQIAGVEQWLPGVMQLLVFNSECAYCQYYNFECVYGASNYGSYRGCNCTKDGHFKVLDDAQSCDPYNDCWKIGSKTIACDYRFKLAVVFGGICIGCLLFLICLCCCAYRCGMRSMRKRRLKRRALWERQPSDVADNVGETMLIDLVGLTERPVEYSYKSIESATRSFSSLVGKGGFGVVFKGDINAASRNKMRNDQEQNVSSAAASKVEIAVKVLDVRSNHSKKQFVNEVAIIGRVHHINVVRLLGFCVHDEHEMLVYEYVSNGSLDKWLFERTNEQDRAVIGAAALDWGQRYSIAIGIARGLSYLHEECRHHIIHCDVKPQNILLDAQMCAKIADFGLARLINRPESRVVTFAKGTPGYMAPELWVGGDIQLSTKADVYSFGMVLLELVSGRKNFAHGLPHFPAVAFHTAVNKGNLDSLLDVRLTRSDLSEQLIIKQQDRQPCALSLMQQQSRIAILVALWCIQDNPASRPCMSAVVQFLEGVSSVSEHPPYPTIASASEGSSLNPI